jgi:hypothetical protein
MGDDDMVPNKDEKIRNLAKIDSLLNKDYLHGIENRYGILNFADYNKIPEVESDGPKYKINYETNVRALQIDRWVFDKEEQIIDKFKNILNVFAGGDSTIALLVRRDKEGAALCFILKNETVNKISKIDASSNNAVLLKSAITGNFNGTIVRAVDNFVPDIQSISSISCLTNIPSEKSEKYISQGLEKLLDGIKPGDDSETYYVLILADPLTHEQIQNIQNGYEELASAIAPYSGYQFSIGKNNTETEGTMESLTNSENIFSSVTKTHSGSAGISVPGVNASYSFSYSKTEGKGSGSAETSGKNYNLSVGTNENTTYNYQSFTVKGLLEKLQKQLERINNGQSLGLWKCASYVLAGSPRTTINVANFLKSLTQGDESYIEPPIINTWNLNGDFFSNILEYLVHFTHPVFGDAKEHITPTYNVSTTELSDIMAFPRKSVSGLPVLECAVFGREVVVYNEKDKQEGNEGCDQIAGNNTLMLGKNYHRHHIEKSDVTLDKNSLSSHAFITGSTGSGKSNTVYQILSEVKKSGAAFLVIEPAKGEYKNVFGNNNDVFVYGTNPALTPLLRINPFTFPHDHTDPKKTIHILEHLDRLVEIFNVCWPMYAAMPAVLKDAIEMSYEGAGWDLQTSKCRFSPTLYPSFADVADTIRKIIDTSEYSDENKGNYKGALVTRLKSLSNGINGMIFTNDELLNADLFDKNVIVDLSRVGSMETKALIMGLLVMKLQEYRLTSGKMNSDLQHITVLEEAHNLLKRTSTEQSSESSNLLGKSVEMLANAIAEMRTYGEGFIIADQAPGLLDLSVIRNTNTKIILRLPDESDRDLVGKAAGLNDDQIVELARLQCGVAAVYQNDWIQPVLCKVEHFKTPEKMYSFDSTNVYKNIVDNNGLDELKKRITLYLLSNMITDPPKENIDSLKESVLRSRLPTGLKTRIARFILSGQKPPQNTKTIFDMVAGLYNYSGDALEKLNTIGAGNIDSLWATMLYNEVTPHIADLSRETQIIIMNCIIQEISSNNKAFKDLREKWMELGRGAS